MRRRTKLWIIIAGVAAVLLLLTVGLTALRGRVRSRSLLVLELSGQIREEGPTSVLERLLEDRVDTILGLHELLRGAALDSRISALLVRVSALDVGAAKAAELREQILRFRESGKPTVALVEYAGTADYYVASACEHVYVVPEGMIVLRGVMADVPFLRGTLDKLHIEPDFIARGRYKTAPEMFTRTDMSPAQREVIDSLLDAMHAQLRDGIAESRGLGPQAVEALINRAVFRSQNAVQAGLADDVLYEDEVVEALEARTGGDLHPLAHTEYQRKARFKQRGPRVAVVFATGEIVLGSSAGAPSGGKSLGSDTMAEILREVREDEGVRAVVLRVDSPGGSATASDVIGREIELTREKKPVVVSMSDLAASGGYWISVPASRVVARAGTLTGSIGVWAGKFNLRGLYDWAGVHREIITRSENADLFSDYRSFSPQQRRMLRQELESIYEAFVSRVAEGRGLDPKQVDRVARGRVWLGVQAKEHGLVDVLGGFDRALQEARELAGIEADQPLRLEYHPRERGLVESLLSGDLARLASTLRRLATQLDAALRLLEGDAIQARVQPLGLRF